MDRSTDLASGCSVSVVHRCRSLLLSFSTFYLDILGLEGAIICILAQTSHQWTNSEKGQKLCSQSVLYSEVRLYFIHHYYHPFTIIYPMLSQSSSTAEALDARYTIDQLAKVCMECMTSHPVALLQRVMYCGEWLNRQVGALKRARCYNCTDYPI